MIKTCSLQSGSNGNCIYVETPDTKLLFDAGISGKTAQQRLAEHDRNINDIDALIISHDHSDHTKAAGVFHRKFKLPIHITPGSWNHCRGRQGQVERVHFFHPGADITFNATTVKTIPTAHDGKDGVAFVIQYENIQLGIFTDLGHPFDGLGEHIAQLDALYLEFNYDPQMLENGDYPIWLKRRISGSGGHLSNAEAALLIRQNAPELKTLILSHLSEHNNHPDLALKSARQALGYSLDIQLAPRYNVSKLFDLTPTQLNVPDMAAVV